MESPGVGQHPVLARKVTLPRALKWILIGAAGIVVLMTIGVGVLLFTVAAHDKYGNECLMARSEEDPTPSVRLRYRGLTRTVICEYHYPDGRVDPVPLEKASKLPSN